MAGVENLSMPFMLYLSLALVLMWSVRLARAKGRNPWLWAGLALAPMFLPAPWQLFSMLPVVVLLFLKSPRPQGAPGPEGVHCPKCHSSQPHGRYYCTNCGWDLAKPYPDDATLAHQGGSGNPATNSTEAVAGGALASANEKLEPSPAQDGPVTAGVPTSRESVLAGDVAPTPEQAAPRPVSRGIPTAAGMTERGLGLFKQGRVQESIDQFTKALALDPNYTPAWEQRAEAYARLGRNKEAAEDRRRLKAINAS